MHMCRVAYLLLIVTVVSVLCQTTAPPSTTDCTFIEQRCTTPEQCVDPVDNVDYPTCGCQCPGCPSCVQARNPVFDKACSANVVLILDESASIGSYVVPGSNPRKTGRTQVVQSVKSFVEVFATVEDIGGAANLAMLEFSDNANFVVDTSNVDGERRLFRLTDENVDAINSYLDAPSTGAPSPNTYDPQYGCTNWGESLGLVATTQSWCAEQLDGTCSKTQCVPQVGSDVCVNTPVRPDIIIWFTDGEPTLHTTGTCERDCNKDRERETKTSNGDTILVGSGNGGDIGSACFYADKLKKAGIKIFLVGVGQVLASASGVANVELVTGPKEWDGNPDTFAFADYAVDRFGFVNLPAFFYGIARGLCQCLVPETPCIPPPPEVGFSCSIQNQFDARIRVTTNGDATVFPVNSQTFGFIYYKFSIPGVSTFATSQFAMDIQAPTSTITTIESVVRTDLYEPCKLLRKISCTTGCFQVADQRQIPRLFLEGPDVAEAPTPGFSSACGTPYKKALNRLTVVTPATIEYVWIVSDPQNPNFKEICAARAIDGTFFEFFKELAGSPGVNLREPLAWSSGPTTDGSALQPSSPPQQVPPYDTLFDFEKYATCDQTADCNAPVDVVVVIGGSFSALDVGRVILYVEGLMDTYDPQSARFGVWINCQPMALVPGLTNNFALLKAELRGQLYVTTAPYDYDVCVTAAIEHFFDVTNTENRARFLLTLVGGANENGQWTNTALTTFNQLRSTHFVRSWSIGIQAGGLDRTLLLNLADSLDDNIGAYYDHVEVLGTADLLSANLRDQATRMCPSVDLCGSNCKGLCVCGVCICANCIGPDPENKCYNVCCDAITKECSAFNKVELLAPSGCLPIAGSGAIIDHGIKYTCDPATGDCLTNNFCAGKSSCKDLSLCQYNDVNLNDCAACNPRPRTCDCNDRCGVLCDERTGSCKQVDTEVICDDQNGCTSDKCVNAEEVDGELVPVCEHKDLGAALCPQSNNPCLLNFCVGSQEVADKLQVPLPTSGVCVAVSKPDLVDICGVCLGTNLTCAFVDEKPNTGAIIGGVIGGVAAAAAAALLAVWARQRGGSAPAPINAGGANALGNNPAYVPDGMVGDMPTI